MATEQPTGVPPPSTIPNLKDRLPKLEPRRRRPAPSAPVPTPETPALPPPPEPSTLSFQVPSRRILSRKDHELFLSSPTHNLILAFVFGLSDAVVDVPISAVKDEDLSPALTSILAILDEAAALLFRTFLDKTKAASAAWHQRLGVASPEAVAEVETYLLQSFGNRSRIDYGSGHELNFMIWLLCLYQLQLVKQSDFKALVLKVFTRYLTVMRTVQSTYYLEPAGSHGVWGLDDYQFLPFLFGSSQLLHHPFITPLAIHQELTIEEFGHDFMYLGQVDFVNSTKTVKGGMRKMFVAEVLAKLPVMQHFLFGSLVPAVDGMSTEAEAGVSPEEEETEGGAVMVEHEGVKHLHQLNSWGDCCGIKVPSSLAAAQEMRKRNGGESLRRIPFD
ncbi:Bcrrd2 [Apiospora hydei]|uniref:Serine/threonine-protein phosphatase 2A activator n=1 Tax=Apiospora hydei TaxID=1337664 RepID=A0ABR1X2V7_9PEZI